MFHFTPIGFGCHDIRSCSSLVNTNLSDIHFPAMVNRLEPSLVAKDGLNLPTADCVRVLFDTLFYGITLGPGFCQSALLLHATLMFNERCFHLCPYFGFQIEKYQFFRFEHILGDRRVKVLFDDIIDDSQTVIERNTISTLQ